MSLKRPNVFAHIYATSMMSMLASVKDQTITHVNI